MYLFCEGSVTDEIYYIQSGKGQMGKITADGMSVDDPLFITIFSVIHAFLA
jgi:hypothetical protein